MGVITYPAARTRQFPFLGPAASSHASAYTGTTDMKCELTILRDGGSFKATAFIKPSKGGELHKTVSITGKDLDVVMDGIVEELKKAVL